jgi:hypothetical protein
MGIPRAHVLEREHLSNEYRTKHGRLNSSDLMDEVIHLRKFKQYVHDRLDQAQIPTHPDGEHSKAGCRVGDRLDIALAKATP